MKTKALLYTIAIAAAGCLSSCNEEFSQPPVILPDGGVGSGAWDSPMTAYQALLGSVSQDYAEPWVTGVIVGFVNTNVGTTVSEQSVWIGDFDSDRADGASVNSNIVIALDKEWLKDIPEENRWENVATVQLPSGNVRTALNLVDHPENLWKTVTIKGTTGEKYCGAYGIRSCSDYNWGKVGIEPVVIGPVEASGPFFENFDKYSKFDEYEALGWRNYTTEGGLSGWYIKTYNDNNYITVSAYRGSQNGGPYENWLVTPPINMDKLSTKTLTFETQAGYQAENSYLECYVMSAEDPSTAVLTKLPAAIATPPESNYSSWVNSGTLDLSAFSGDIYIGWKYYSEKGGDGFSTTYCIDNVNVGNASTETPETPAGDELFSFLQPSLSELSGWTFDNVTMGGTLSKVWYWDTSYNDHYLKANAYVGGAVEALSYAYTAVSLAGVSGAAAEFEHAAKFQTNIKELGRFVIRVAGSSEWTELEIPEWPAAGAWKFAKSGRIDISAFDGKEVELGFKYQSTDSAADTWEVNNLKIYGSK